MDFYRELGDLFGVPLASHNRWAELLLPCARAGPITSAQPVAGRSSTVDEAQETSSLPSLASFANPRQKGDLDSKQLLYASSSRAMPDSLERLRAADLPLLGSRIRRRLHARLRPHAATSFSLASIISPRLAGNLLAWRRASCASPSPTTPLATTASS